MAPYDSHLLIFLPCVISSSWIATKPSDSLIANRLWQKWWDVHSEIRLQNESHFHLACPPLLSCLLNLVKANMARKWGRLQVNSQQRTEAFSPIAHQQLNPTTHVSEPENGSVLSLFFRWDHSPANTLSAALWESLKLRHPVKPCLDSWITETVR